MRRFGIRQVLVVLVMFVVAGCGGGGGSENTPPTSTGSKKLTMAVKLGAFELRNGVDGKYAVITFNHLSSGRIDRTLPLPHPNPTYPMTVQPETGYNQIEVRYPGVSVPELTVNFIPLGGTAKSAQPSYNADAAVAASPNVVPHFGGYLMLLAPTAGDYSQVVSFNYQTKEGAWENNFLAKPLLPLAIPFKAGFERVAVSTGVMDSNGTYKEGKRVVWEYEAFSTTPPSDPPIVNKPPVANAGPDQTVILGATVQLNGSASDPNNDQLTYRWTFATPVGSQATLSNANVVTTSFSADKVGAYTANLIANDGKVDSIVDSVTITVINPTDPPIPNTKTLSIANAFAFADGGTSRATFNIATGQVVVNTAGQDWQVNLNWDKQSIVSGGIYRVTLSCTSVPSSNIRVLYKTFAAPFAELGSATVACNGNVSADITATATDANANFYLDFGATTGTYTVGTVTIQKMN